ncbi:glycosyltransferase family A protein [Idiomarina abyssalis]|uniref:glycosyltransferase family A protein n=1 Tax=Idiomarina abyssalis TaxID=86102 RepID=UPI001C937D74|nr:glycosyltransferase family A protein [Idiomarina abyssalis]QZN91419.1 glycosyltransferase family 2 protein [Idiomarina abyssalis]
MTNKDIEFSVVVPIYNKASYVERAVESVLKQSFINFEVILVCDPSTDGSEQVVESIIDDRIRIIYRDKPGPGGYAARNLGITSSKGRWIALLDADDMWYPEHLEKALKLTKQYPDKKVLTTSRLIEEKGKVKTDAFSKHFRAKGLESRGFSFLEYLQLSFQLDKPFNSNSIIFHKDCVNGDVFPEGKVKRSGDILAWLKLTSQASGFAWSSYLGSHTYKDVVGVSKTSLPSIGYNFEFAQPLYDKCDKSEAKMLDRYLNRLVKIAWFEHRRAGSKISPLWRYFRFRNSFFYCIFWSFVSTLPKGFVEKLTNLKKRVAPI